MTEYAAKRFLDKNPDFFDPEDDAIELVLSLFIGECPAFYDYDEKFNPSKAKNWLRTALRSYGDMRFEQGKHIGIKDPALKSLNVGYDLGKEEGRRETLEELESRLPALEKDYSHSHCYDTQDGHDKHLRCCICRKDNPNLVIGYPHRSGELDEN